MNIHALRQAGYAKPKDRYTTVELKKLSVSRLRALSRERLNQTYRKNGEQYLVIDINRNAVVDTCSVSTLRDNLIHHLQGVLS
jgi:hypothetical protein